VPFHPEGFGIVGFATLSRSEKILMTYRLTGTISYWELDSGRLLEELQSVPLLAQIRLTPDLSSLIGSTKSEIYVIDVASGRVQARAPLADIASLDISASGNEIACIAGKGAVSSWSIGQGTVTQAAGPPPAFSNPSVLRYALGNLILGTGAGDLVSFDEDGKISSFPSDERALITGMAVRGNACAIATSSWIKVFTAGLSEVAREEARDGETLGCLQMDNPFRAPTDLTFLDDSSLLAWQTGDGPGTYAMLDLRTATYRSSPGDPLSSPVMSAVSDGSRCLILTKDGTLRIIDVSNGAITAQTRRPGTMGAAFAAGNTVIIGGRAGDAEPGSLVKINMDTGETDPIPTANRYTYDVLYDATASTLFSLGVDAEGTTNLLANTGTDLQSQSVVESTPGEHLSARLCLDGSAGTLFTSLGREQIIQWKRGSLHTLTVSARGTLAMFFGDGLLYSLNNDSSVSLIDVARNEKIAELSVFPDGGWALLMQKGKFAASAGSQSHISVLQNDKPVQDPGAYLVPVRLAERRGEVSP
jgi:WD40 repeat protein